MSHTGTLNCFKCRKTFITDWPENQIINGPLVLGIIVVKKRTACPQCHATFLAVLDLNKCALRFTWEQLGENDVRVFVGAPNRERAGTAKATCVVCTEDFDVPRPILTPSCGDAVDTLMAAAETVTCQRCGIDHRPVLSRETVLACTWVEDTSPAPRPRTSSLIVMPGAPLR